MIQKISVLFLVVIAISCGNQNDETKGSESHPHITSGAWRFSLDLNGRALPFNVELYEVDTDNPRGVIINASEQIPFSNVTISADSLFLEIGLFNAALNMRIESPSLITGEWRDYDKENYAVPLVAEYDKDYRFTPSKSSTSTSSQYKVTFYENDSTSQNAILVLDNDTGRLSGTFLTETGDYRYLDGNVMNQSIYLSTFDGSHAFLFQAKIKGDSLVDGIFNSGIHYESSWVGVVDSLFQLRNPKALTFLNPGYDKFNFRLPNQDGDTVTWEDLNLDGKVVIIDIMGSWCPNCIDANKAIKELIAPYDKSDIELVPIAFEYTDNLKASREKVFNMQRKIGLPEKFLFGGLASKKNAADKLPALNHVMSFPTLLFIDKERNVEQIYTGFYGPGTGRYYREFMVDTKQLLNRLISERS